MTEPDSKRDKLGGVKGQGDHISGPAEGNEPVVQAHAQASTMQ